MKALVFVALLLPFWGMGQQTAAEYEQQIRLLEQRVRELSTENDSLNALSVQLSDTSFAGKLMRENLTLREIMIGYVKQIDALNLQLGDCQQQGDRNREMSARYLNSIMQADEAFAKKDYITAKRLYNEAIAVAPTGNYPKLRITEIDRILYDKKP